MLSPQEKDEMLEDGRDPNRRQEFARSGALEKISLDEHIQFLMSLQKIFGPMPVFSNPTITKLNKL